MKRQIRNGSPGQHGTPPADHWVAHPALTIKQQGAPSRTKLRHPAGRPAASQRAHPSATRGSAHLSRRPPTCPRARAGAPPTAP